MTKSVFTSDAPRQVVRLTRCTSPPLERARGTIEREITEPDVAEITQPRDDFVAQHLRRGVVRRQRNVREQIARAIDRQRVEFRQRQRVRGSDDPIIQRVGLKTSAVATRAGRVGAIAAEQNAHVHFVGLALEPVEKSAHAVPAIVLVIVLVVLAVFLFAVDDEVLVGFRQFLERRVHIDLLARAGPQQILLRFAHFLSAKNAHHALRDRERAIRNGAVQIDRDGAAEAAAFRTGAERIVETEEPGRGRTNIEIAMRAMPAGRRTDVPVFVLRARRYVDLVFAETQRDLDRFGQTRAVLFGDRDAILDDLHARAERPTFLSVSARTISPFSQTRR